MIMAHCSLDLLSSQLETRACTTIPGFLSFVEMGCPYVAQDCPKLLGSSFPPTLESWNAGNKVHLCLDKGNTV
ncbi:hypothetical protein AAY473_018085 [Plecturocebus cupreus]